MESGFAVIILLACVLSPHTHPCTRLHPLSPITRSTTFGTKSLGCVFTLPRWQVHRVRLLLKKKGEELVLSCGFAQDLSCSGSDRRAGSSQTPPLPGRPAASPSSGRTRHLARWTRTRSFKAVASRHHCLALGYDSFLYEVFTTAAVRHAATRFCMCAVTDLGTAVTKGF